MIINQRKSLTLVFLYFIFLPTLVFAENQHNHFAFSEQTAAGNAVKLHFTPGDKGEAGKHLTLPTGMTLTYGELLSLGDFYGILDGSITQGKNLNERKARFIAVFNQFAKNSRNMTELKQIIDVVHYEQHLIEKAIQQGADVSKVFEKNANETGRRINCITGGGCMTSGWWLKPGRALKLANTNYDHFRPYAMKAYEAGHAAAIEQALIAHAKQDASLLEVAYAMNALASHYLSDRFAAGHIRTPRKMLSDRITPATAGSLLAHYMHNEENEAGIWVHNKPGERWISYGDTHYFDKKNEYNRKILLLALQASAAEIFHVWRYGTIPQDTVDSLIPFPDEETTFKNNISPLFYWRKSDNKLLRRQNIANAFDRHFTADWWGWSTLAELKRIKGFCEIEDISRSR